MTGKSEEGTDIPLAISNSVHLLELLTKLPTEKRFEFIHKAIDHFSGKQISYDDKTFKVVNAIQVLCEYCVGESQTTDQMKQFFNTLEIPEAISQDLISAFSARSEDVKKFLVEKASENSHSYLKDFDWKLQMLMSSDKLALLKDARLLLNLSVVHNNVQKSSSSTKNTQDVLVELSREDLDSLIHNLEEINESMQQFKLY